MSELKLQNIIGGGKCAASSGKTFDDWNPARPEARIATAPDSDAADVERAVAAAKGAFKSWSRTPAPARGEVIYRIAERLRARKEDLSRLMTREMGKVITEARGDVQE